MCIEGFLHKILSSASIHKKRFVTFSILISTLLKSKKLSLTELGRALDLSIQQRSAIRRVDRFLGNTKLHAERKKIYQCVMGLTIKSSRNPNIIVDWCHVTNTTNHILRASLAADGRAITLYEEVHEEKNLATASVHYEFLKTLRKLLPEECKPIIITDAGFHNEWFKTVLRMGWDFLGRIRGKKYYRKTNQTSWELSRNLFAKATTTPKYIGDVELCRLNTLKVRMCLFKNKHKNSPRTKKSSRKGKEYKQSAKEPWVLATSLPKSYTLAKKMVYQYAQRMQIEECFRDIKSTQYGFGMKNARTKDPKRIEILLLIAMIASLIAWLLGWIIEKKNLHLQFQSNSIKHKRVLSLFFLGCQFVRKKIALITVNSLILAAREALC